MHGACDTEVPERKAGPRARAERDPPLDLLVFGLGGEAFAFPVDSIREVLRPGDLTRVPNVPQHVAGVMNVRSRLVAVIDLGLRLELGPVEADRRARVIVCQANGGRVGILVGSVREVVTVPPGAVQPPESLGRPTDFAAVRGIARIGDRVVQVLDPAALLEGGGREQRGAP